MPWGQTPSAAGRAYRCAPALGVERAASGRPRCEQSRAVHEAGPAGVSRSAARERGLSSARATLALVTSPLRGRGAAVLAHLGNDAAARGQRRDRRRRRAHRCAGAAVAALVLASPATMQPLAGTAEIAGDAELTAAQARPLPRPCSLPRQRCTRSRAPPRSPRARSPLRAAALRARHVLAPSATTSRAAPRRQDRRELEDSPLRRPGRGPGPSSLRTGERCASPDVAAERARGLQLTARRARSSAPASLTWERTPTTTTSS